MKILLGGDCDNGGGSYWLADAINKYTPHKAKAVRGYQSYLDYPHHILGIKPKEMYHLVKWADVIHIRDRLPAADLHNKAVVITYTGKIFRKCSRAVTKAIAAGWIVCVVTPDMTGYCNKHKAHWLPNPRESMAHLWRPARGFLLCQAPTSRSAKHTEVVIKAAKLAGVKLDVIEQISYQECVKRKARARVTVDQLKYGYGNNAIEAWALGMPVISGAKQPGCREAILENCGLIPYAEARPTAASVRARIEQLRDDQSYYKQIQELGQEHFYTFHHAPVVADKAISIYKEALDAS